MGARCSLPLQYALLALHTARVHLGALGDTELAATLYARSLRRTLLRLLRTYWQVCEGIRTSLDPLNLRQIAPHAHAHTRLRSHEKPSARPLLVWPCSHDPAHTTLLTRPLLARRALLAQDVSPSFGRSETYARDLRLLCAIAFSASAGALESGDWRGGGGGGESGDGGSARAGRAGAAGGGKKKNVSFAAVEATLASEAPAAAPAKALPPAAAAAHAAATAAAAAEAGIGPPALEDAPLEVERYRLGQVALWLLALLALHRAPLPLVAAFLRQSRAGEGGGGGAAGVEWAQVGVDTLAEGSAAAVAALKTLALDDVEPPTEREIAPPCGAGSEKRVPLETLGARGQRAVAAPLPQAANEAAAAAAVAAVAAAAATTDSGSGGGGASGSGAADGRLIVDWAALLTWQAFPLRSFPHLVRHALRKLPVLSPAAQPYLPDDDAALKVAIDELAQMLSLASSATPQEGEAVPRSGIS